MSGFDARRRSLSPERMDVEDVPPAELAACLADLARVNTVTLARRPTLWWLRRVTRPGEALHLLDVGFGDGDMLRAIRRWDARHGVGMTLTGIDINPETARIACAATPAAMEIDYVTADLFAYQPRRPVDLIVSSLFAHHLDDAALVRFLHWMEATARRGWFVNDLRRSGFAYHGFRLLSRLASWHELIRHDGPLSVARAMTVAEWRALLKGAGVTARARGRFPFRLEVGKG